MTTKTKIIVAGIGGVGGYFGGLLAKAYAGNDNIEVYFIARGNHLEQIRNHGLKVIKGNIVFTANPFLATANAAEIGTADYIIVCTKNYDLDEILTEVTPCIDEQTTILPLLNGVEAAEKIRAKFPNNLVPAGCAYIVSAIKDPGIVENMGNRQDISFGLDNETDERLTKLEDLLKSAGIEATLSQEISKLIWEKFIFLSSIATATSYCDKTVGELLEEHRDLLKSLIDEVTAIALAKNIKVDEQTSIRAIAHYESLPFTATSSMQRDFNAKKLKTELNSITGYVVKEGEELNVATPLFKMTYLALLKKQTIS
ncbi:2-dehydropantoate 2-reductase [Pedobacter polaris]|uniref:2-dehydropantoate 2-reductase n=1 Tax=Pedobacter polaris TaxID=2571273 RepID=A0A4U1CE00_9SPHI|nr:2-dehydropantoate 2-reductase [Pedobacter polaris]TKC04635.1 2-dehydropantoate 2-reductase [Pedobacter polaris]